MYVPEELLATLRAGDRETRMEEWQRLNDGAEIEVTAVIVVCRLIRPRRGIPRPQVSHLLNVKQSGSVLRVCISRFLSWYSYVLVCLVCIEDLFGLRIIPLL